MNRYSYVLVKERRCPEMNEITLKVYNIKNLDCAHCASKIEAAINEMEEVEEAILVFTSKKFRIKARHTEELFNKISSKCDAIEPGVELIEEGSGTSHRTRRNHSHVEEHHHHDHEDDHCCCHDHDHEHEHEHEHHHHDHEEDHCCCHDHDHDHEHEHEHEHHHHDHEEDHCCCGHDHEHEHEHEHHHEEKTVSEHSHDHVHTHEHDESEKSELPVIIAGAVLLVAAKIAESFVGNDWLKALMYIVPYLILGWEILSDAFKGILRGRVFNEKFLMSIATIAAFVLKEYPEAVGVMLFFRIGEYFEDKAVEKSRKSVMDAIDMRPETVNLVEGSEVTVIPAEEAEPDDIILVRAGDRIPLDGVVVEGKSEIDTSSITGEHLPVAVKEHESVLSGCVNLSGVLKIRVTKYLSESMVSRIVDSVENAAAGKPKIDRFITRFANVYTPVVVAAAALTAVVPSLITGDWRKWIYTAVTFLVISCPCAIVLSVPLTYFAGIGAGSKKGILFKSGSSIEAVSDVKAVVMDKTGTITSGIFSVDSTETYSDTDEKELCRICASCEAVSTHPVAQCIVRKSEELELKLSDAEDITEFAGMGMEAVIDGKRVTCGNAELMKNRNIDISSYTPGEACTDVLCAVDGVLAGCFRISDTLKGESISAIKDIRSRGIKTVMLTGDSEASAAKTARETNIDRYFAKLLPEEKLEKMKDIRSEYGAVMFVGDGINDAPVLAGADVSAAMGSGADAAIEAADIVIMNSEMDAVPKALKISSDTNHIAKQNIIFALAFKLAVMILGIAGFANMWFAVFADSGVAMLCVLNSIRILRKKY